MIECTYCGSIVDIHRHHIMPVSTIGRRSYTDQTNLTPACAECNVLLRDLVFESDRERKDFLIKRYRKRYRDVLNMPKWDEEDLLELSEALQLQIRAKESLRSSVSARIEQLMSEDGPEPKVA